MRFNLPVLWVFQGTTLAGRLEVAGGRVILTSKRHSLSFGLDDIADSAIDRGPSSRLRGLPVLSVRLAQGDVVKIASLGGVGSLHDLAGAVSTV